ncbi:MAG: Nramp family divalent metal transporter, partial [Ignavibacteriaceae bacterium]
MKKFLDSSAIINDDRTRILAEETLSGNSKKGIIRRLLPFLGPAFIASIAYVDPGNFATNIQGGAEFGYTLLWVILASNLMAMLIQALSAKLGIATGNNLAEHCRNNFSKPVVYTMWVLMELVAMATDLAEFLGAAIGFQLLFGFPLIIGGILTAICTFLILGLERYGFRPLEIAIAVLAVIIALCYIIETILDKPDVKTLLYHTFVPQFSGTESILLATGILGATVMPHAIFLHSALTQQRIIVKHPDKLKKLFRFEIYDILIAMGIASFVNMAMLIMSAATFHQHGYTNVATIEDAHLTLKPLLGQAASWIFAISLLASGLSSSTVGTSAGQVIMQGFLHRHIPVWLRRLITSVRVGSSPTAMTIIEGIRVI